MQINHKKNGLHWEEGLGNGIKNTSRCVIHR